MDSTINLWSTRKSLRKKASKTELLELIKSKINKTIDLNNLTQKDLHRVLDSIGSISGPMPVCRSKADYIKFLQSLIPDLKSANRLTKSALKELAEEFDDKTGSN
jgi:hypothetical protein